MLPKAIGTYGIEQITPARTVGVLLYGVVNELFAYESARNARRNLCFKKVTLLSFAHA